LRNALVVSIGFLPLFISPLVPYNTVGLFMFVIMLFASFGTLMVLPALVSAHPGIIFYEPSGKFMRHCPQCLMMSLVVSGGVAYVLIAYSGMKWNITTLISLSCVVVLSMLCFFISKGKKCFSGRNMKEGL